MRFLPYVSARTDQNLGLQIFREGSKESRIKDHFVFCAIYHFDFFSHPDFAWSVSIKAFKTLDLIIYMFLDFAG